MTQFMEFKAIQEQLKLLNILIDSKSVKRHNSKGFMSDIYSADSNKGKVIIHIITPVDEQQKQQIHKKVLSISRLLQKYPEIPTARVFLSGELGNKFFIVQSFIEGIPVGNRILENDIIKDIYTVENAEEFIKQTQKLLAKLHHIPLKKYGYLTEYVEGTHNNWFEFLSNESKFWLETIYKNSKDPNEAVHITQEEYNNLNKQLQKFLQKHREELSCSKAGLVHCDMINPGNILVNLDSQKITGIIDFEWSLAADPAWEFAFTDEINLHHYFEERKKLGASVDEKQFRNKVKLYKVLWLLWGTNVHAKGDLLKKILFKDFKKKLSELS